VHTLKSFGSFGGRSTNSIDAEWEAAQAAVAAMGSPSASSSAERQSSSAKVTQLQPQIGPDGEDKHNSWLRSKVNAKSQELPNTEANRRTLWELLSMLAVRNKCRDVLDAAGLGGAMKPNDTVYIRGHTGLWFGVKSQTDVMCNKDKREDACAWIIDSKVNALRNSSRIALRMSDKGEASRMCMGVDPSGAAKVMPRSGARDNDTQFQVQVLSDTPPGAIVSGMAIMLRSVGAGKNLDVEGEIVRARSNEQGTLQRLVLEKLPPDEEIPPACSDRDLSIPEQAWVFRRGVQLAVVDKQAIAKFLSLHKGNWPQLLKSYTMLWEVEWRSTRSAFGDDESCSRSPSERSKTSNVSQVSKRPSSRPRARTMDRIFDMFGTSIPAEDKVNGDMFTDALRSYFSTAMRMSQLEADCVQRVIEAFAAALVSDKEFIQAFKKSMLPEKERQTYCTPEEVLFGLAYTTMMLNTDAHNQQVTQKL
jgi:hypothetical protein